MSVTFSAKRADASRISLDIDHPAFLNISSANARAFLLFLGLVPGDEPMGTCTLPEARRAIMRARATFERRVEGFTREASDTRRPGTARAMTGGIDAHYLATRLDAF